MADYHSPTVVVPHIPFLDMTRIEQFLLTQVFESERDADAIYLFAEQYMTDMPVLNIDEVRTALADSAACRTADYIREQLDRLKPNDGHLELDEEIPWEMAFQDIVRRSETIDHFEVITSFTCSRMRSDGWGGAITIITADQVLSSSTEEMARKFLDRVQYGEVGRAPGHGEHVLLRLCEPHIRQTIEVIFETEAPKGLALADVTDDDIREAALAILATSDLSHEEAMTAFNAALAAIRIAAARREAAR